MYIDNITSDSIILNSDGKAIQIGVYEQLIEQLLRENKQLETQLSGTTFCYDEEEHQKLKDQQKEFINYLQKKINQYASHVEAVDSVCTSIYSSDYDNSKIKLAIYKEILQKYKEIVNGFERK